MLSIIICSVNPDLLERVKENIDQTVGVPYEVIAIDNRTDPKGICEVYNRGADKAVFENLCFVHEDIRFATQDWGAKLCQTLKDPTIGLVGVAGSAYKPKIVSGWGAQGLDRRFAKMNFVQHFRSPRKPPVHEYSNAGGGEVVPVVCVDGMFLATRKTIIKDVPFDEKMLQGFHGYDMDISIAIGRKYKVVVIYSVLIEHFSEGSLDRDWLESALVVHRKWKNVLPLAAASISKEEKTFCEKETFAFLFERFRAYLSLPKAFQILNTGELINLDFRTYFKITKGIFASYLKKF